MSFLMLLNKDYFLLITYDTLVITLTT